MRATQSVRLNREVREGILPPTVGQCRVKINLGPFLVETLLYIIQLLIVNYLYNVHPSMLLAKRIGWDRDIDMYKEESNWRMKF